MFFFPLIHSLFIEHAFYESCHPCSFKFKVFSYSTKITKILFFYPAVLNSFFINTFSVILQKKINLDTLTMKLKLGIKYKPSI